METTSKGIKWDWPTIYREYITGNEPNVSEFCRKKGIPEDTMNKYTTGWRDEYRKVQQEILVKAREKIILTSADKIAEEYTHLMNLAKLLQQFGYKAIANVKDGKIVGAKDGATHKEGIMSLRAGIAAQIELLNMGKEQKGPVVTNVINNVNSQVTVEQVQKFNQLYESLKKYNLIGQEENEQGRIGEGNI